MSIELKKAEPWKLSNETVKISGKIVAITDKAILVEVDELFDEAWIPLSQIVNEDDYFIDELVDLEITEWIAIAKGIV